jgi:retron-type reverse transcriptase
LRQLRRRRFFESATPQLPHSLRKHSLGFATMFAPPPFFVSFPDFTTYAKCATSALRPDELQAAERLSSRGLPVATSVQALSLLFGYSMRFLGAMERRPTRYYRTFEIPKGRSSRKISSPRIALKVIQSWFGYHGARAIEYASHVHGFVPTRSCRSAAAIHCGADWVISVDVADFFPSITTAQVHDALKNLGYPGAGAWLCAKLCTLNAALPQGAPSSPFLSNLVFAAADVRLASLAAEKRIHLSRYADDITLSGAAGQFDDTLVTRVSEVLRDAGFEVSHQKTRISKKPEPLRVLGLLVDSARPRLSRKYRHKLRMIKHLLETTSDVRKKRSFLGHLSYGNSIETA